MMEKIHVFSVAGRPAVTSPQAGRPVRGLRGLMVDIRWKASSIPAQQPDGMDHCR